jgi:hypothetical protein
VASRTCSVCGRPLRAGVCPEGHPQRAARSRKQAKGGRAWGRKVIPALVIVLVLGGLGYGALVWYPVGAARSVMEPTSAEYVEALDAYREAVTDFPGPGELDAAAGFLEVTDRARSTITDARIGLESRELPSIPVISDRPPIRLSEQAREEMIQLYSGSLELVGDMEAAAGFLSDVSAVLPSLDNLRSALTVPSTPAEAAQVAAATRPIAEQLAAEIGRAA